MTDAMTKERKEIGKDLQERFICGEQSTVMKLFIALAKAVGVVCLVGLVSVGAAVCANAHPILFLCIAVFVLICVFWWAFYD